MPVYVALAMQPIRFRIHRRGSRLLRLSDLAVVQLQEEGGQAEHPLAVASRMFFDSMQVSGGLALLAANLPMSLRPLICRLSHAISPLSGPLNRSLDVIFAATQQMVEAYAAAHPELDVDATPDRAILQRGYGRRVLEEGAVPTEHSLIAHMLRAHNKCAPPPPPTPRACRCTLHRRSRDECIPFGDTDGAGTWWMAKQRRVLHDPERRHPDARVL